jgi:hypothetical protein
MEIPDGLRARLAGMAAADRETLIAEVRAEAREQAKALLREAYVRELLEERNAPAPEAGDGWWVYCVLGEGRDLPAGATGLGEQPRFIAAAGLTALVSRVPLSEFGEAPLRENLNDLNWLERTVRAHEAVLDAMLPGALVPMRVCTIYSDEAQVRAMLESREALLREALTRVAGKQEWGVKIVADRARLEEHARREVGVEAEVDGKSEGGAYLARKQLAGRVREEADRMLDGAVRETHARLEEWAAGSVILPAQNRELAGYEGDMIFNGAYLVEEERTDQFTALLDELRAQYVQLGLQLDLTGPWPAYNFAAAEPATEVRS